MFHAPSRRADDAAIAAKSPENPAILLLSSVVISNNGGRFPTADREELPQTPRRRREAAGWIADDVIRNADCSTTCVLNHRDVEDSAHNASRHDGAASPADDELRRAIEDLGPWFQNLKLRGIETAADHFLGDYPAAFFTHFAEAIPDDLTGWSVLDIGCNAGFYAFEMKRRGAETVLGIDHDPHYLRQAVFAASTLNLDVDLQLGDVYDVRELGRSFDLVLFTGVLYHLRHPLLALDLLRRFVVRRLLVFQTMLRGSSDQAPVAADYDFADRAPFDEPGYPRLHFVERRYAGDASNWWLPNRACAEAMLRSAGFHVLANPHQEVFICSPDPAVTPSLPRAFGGSPRD